MTSERQQPAQPRYSGYLCDRVRFLHFQRHRHRGLYRRAHRQVERVPDFGNRERVAHRRVLAQLVPKRPCKCKQRISVSEQRHVYLEREVRGGRREAVLLGKVLSALLQLHAALHRQTKPDFIGLVQQRMLPDCRQVLANRIRRLARIVPPIVVSRPCSLHDIISGILEACTLRFGTAFHDCLQRAHYILPHHSMSRVGNLAQTGFFAVF